MWPELIWLRPWFGLALPVLCFLVWRFSSLKNQHRQAVKDWFDAHLLAYLSRQGRTINVKWLTVALYASAVCISIFLAGPALKTLESEQYIEKRAAVFVFDLGFAGLATDITPNRLSHMKYKVEDLISAAPNYEYGLVVASGESYPVAPVSPDSATLMGHLPSLTPYIMPVLPEFNAFSKLDFGVELAVQLLKGAGYSNGVIVVLGSEQDDETIARMLAVNDDFQLVFWQFGLSDGGPIILENDTMAKDAKGNVIISRVKPSSVKSDEIVFFANQSDDSDVTRVADLISQQDSQLATEIELGLQQWVPIDSYFLFPVLLLLMPLMRRPNWIFSVVLGNLLSLSLPVNSSFADTQDIKPPAPVSPLKLPLAWRPDMLMHADHISIKQFNAGEYDKALLSTQSTSLKAAYHVALGQYEQAERLLENPTSAVDHYHLGLVFTAYKDFDQALSAFDAAYNSDAALTQAKDNYNALSDFLAATRAGSESGNQSGDNQSQEESQEYDANDQQNGQGSEQGKKQQQSGRIGPTQHTTTAQSLNSHANQGGAGQQSNQDSSGTQSKKSSFSQDQLVAKGKTHGQVDEADVEQNELLGAVNGVNALDRDGIKALVNKVPSDPSFLLKQRLALMKHQRQTQQQKAGQ